MLKNAEGVFQQPVSGPPGAAGDATRILLTRGLRGFADGMVGVLLAGYLTRLGFTPLEIGAILTGTLLGIFVAYGFVNPLANRVKFNNAAEEQYLKCIMQAVAGFAKGLAPLTAVEVARRSLDSNVQPGAGELELALKALSPAK